MECIHASSTTSGNFIPAPALVPEIMAECSVAVHRISAADGRPRGGETEALIPLGSGRFIGRSRWRAALRVRTLTGGNLIEIAACS
jgi:hypothetical protein